MTDHPFPDIEQRPTGYVIEAEEPDELARTATDLPFMAAEVPDRQLIDPRKILPVVNQGQMGSCVGNSGCTVLEWCNWLDGGQFNQFSRMFAYLEAQKYSGFFGKDQGAAIIGMAKAGEGVGICLETTFPYPSRYSKNIPDGALPEAAQHKLMKHTVLRSYDDARTFLLGFQGAIQIGVSLVQSIDNCRSDSIETLSGSSRGGHAMCWIELADKKDSQGRNYFWGPNSWGKGWGQGGWAMWAPSVVDSICRNQTAIGFSTLTVYDPRVIDWSMKPNPGVQAA